MDSQVDARLGEIQRSLGRLESDVGAIRRGQGELKEYTVRINERVHSLEQTRAEGVGALRVSKSLFSIAIGVVGAVFGVLGAFLKEWLL